jgi:hypothetical protein
MSLYAKAGKAKFAYTFFGLQTFTTEASQTIPTGRHHRSFYQPWFPQRARVRADTMLAALDPSSWGRSTRTAHEHSEPLGWAEIRHPFHPLRGQSFPVLKTRRLAGVDTLILRGLERGTFSVAREWTDWADPDPYSALGLPPRRWDLDLLLDLANLLEQLSSKSSRKLPKGD